MGFKRKHSVAVTSTARKVVDISPTNSTAVKTALSTLETPHAGPGSPLGTGVNGGLDFALCCAGPA